MPEEIQDQNIEQAFKNIFGQSASATGIEEVLKEAAKHTLQISAGQSRQLLLIEDTADKIALIDIKYGINTGQSQRLRGYVQRWTEYHKNLGSQAFIKEVAGYISLGKFVTSGLIQMSVQKK